MYESMLETFFNSSNNNVIRVYNLICNFSYFPAYRGATKYIFF